MSQERIIRFSLQHNFVVKHPYENMVSFVTHAKRIGKTIFYLRMCMFLGHFIYLKQVYRSTIQCPCLGNIVYYWEVSTFHLSLISMIVIKIDMSSERGEEKCRIPRELSLATLFALFLIFWTYFPLPFAKMIFLLIPCVLLHTVIYHSLNIITFRYKTLSLSSQTNK